MLYAAGRSRAINHVTPCGGASAHQRAQLQSQPNERSTMHGKLSLTDGVVSARVAPDAYMDAAVTASGEVGGIELALEGVTVFLGQEPNEQKANPILSLALDAQTMQVLALILLDRLGSPAFSKDEWLEIADACEVHKLDKYATEIRAAYERRHPDDEPTNPLERSS